MGAAIIPAADSSPFVLQVGADAHLVDLWLHGRSRHTQRAFRADIARFLVGVEKPLVQVTVGDLQAFADSLAQLAPPCRRGPSARSGPLAFGHRRTIPESVVHMTSGGTSFPDLQHEPLMHLTVPVRREGNRATDCTMLGRSSCILSSC